MPAITLYFQVHQPFRLKRYTFLNVGHDHSYFDDEANGAIFRKVAKKCYVPANKLLLELIESHAGKLRCAFSITGTAIEQMERYCPEVLEGFRRLAATGCVEFLAETYYHSLACLYDVGEFREQVRLHTRMIQEHFGHTPTVFRNTELLYSDEIGSMVSSMGFKGVLAEGADDILGWRSPNVVYQVPGTSTKLLLKNYRLSDDIAFRFSDHNWPGYPLTADKFVMNLGALEGTAETVGIFIDYETFGEHQWESTGIFEFLRHMPEAVLKNEEWSFLTPTEVIQRCQAVSDLSFNRLTSWADVNRDISAWRGNRMQTSAFDQIYDTQKIAGLESSLKGFHSEKSDTWRKLQTSDHFYYMCTKSEADGAVHAYFSPFETPYDAFINYMNILRDFRSYLPSSQEVVTVDDAAPVIQTKADLVAA